MEEGSEEEPEETSKAAQCLALLILKFARRWVCRENPVRRSAGGVVPISLGRWETSSRFISVPNRL